MRGQLQYKDIHGRVWVLSEHTMFTGTPWQAETLDRGHTDDPRHVAAVLDDLILLIDSEEYLIESRKLTSQQTGQGAESVRLPEQTGAEASKERLSEISQAASEAERDDPEERVAYIRPEERDE